MSEHEHKILHTTSGGFYCAYVDCDLELLTPKDFMALLNRIKALEGVVEATKGCIHYLEEAGYCEGCDKGQMGQRGHNKWCNIGKLVEALKKLGKQDG